MSRTTLAGVAALALAFAATPTLVASAGAPDSAPTAASPQATLPTEGLDILLTNDDGHAAPGINAVYDALTAAGHNVTMVAPTTNYSGVSSSIQFSGNTAAVHPIDGDDNKWGVDLSPAGTILFALDVVLEEKPDLVVSGTNVGSNTGFDVNFSGTVGAATIASGMQDIPAIAISTATERWGSDTVGPYDETAEFLVDLIDRGVPLLPRGQLLNINHPVLNDDRPEPLGVTYTANAQASAAAFGYVEDDDTTTDEVEYRIQGARSTETPAAGSDSDMLSKGWITVSVLDSDRSVDATDAPAVAALVREINGDPVPPAKPGKPAVEALPKTAKKNKPVVLATDNVAKGAAVKVTWEPLGNRQSKKIKQTVKTKRAHIKFKAPKRKGRYLVTVKIKKVKVANLLGVVRVK